ncbi:MAG: hypothetical protein EON90_11750 [Brevundimonas sp.]|nr:MAG: hypothetical protein EON90_11750 [Brevundimonas sp.]
MPNGYDTRLRNYARGGQSFRKHRQKIAILIDEIRPRKPGPLPRYLDDSLFKLDDSWIALAVNDRDWRHLAKLLDDDVGAMTPAFVELARASLRANAGAIRDVYAFDRALAPALLAHDFDKAADLMKALPGQADRSLYAYRLTAALHSNHGEHLVEWFKLQPLTEWVKQRFVYPFVYYYLNIPPDNELDFHMSMAMPPGHENKTEKVLIEFLLRDEIHYDTPLAAKIYAGLLCHPFDLCEMMANHLEHRAITGSPLSDPERALLADVRALAPSERLSASFRDDLPVIATATGVPAVLATLALPAGDVEALDHCLSLTVGSEPVNMTKGVASLWRMRRLRHPDVSDYEIVVGMARGYHGTLAGRLVACILTAFFLIPRRASRFEAVQALRTATFLGRHDAFVASCPSGMRAIEARLGSGERMSGTVMAAFDRALDAPMLREDRAWIKQAHWGLAKLERDGRLREWMHKVLAEIPVAPAYLTGIDWDIFLDTLDKVRVGPFRGDVAAAYCLLLHQIEDRPRESNALRLVLEPIAARSESLADFVNWLEATYDRNAVAFVRFFLTADNILWLDLAPNYTAALTQRVDILTAQAKKYGLCGEVLNEAILAQEERALSTSLVLLNVDVNQFDIAWDVISRDAASRNAGIFEAYLTVSAEDEDGPLISVAKQEVPHKFPNGEARRYVLVAREFPLIRVILGVIDTFMDHPSHGIEAILSIRIRHNNFRREILRALNNAAVATYRKASLSDRQYLVPKFEDAVSDAVQDWLDVRMHQRRADKPKGYFDFIPSPVEIRDMLDRLARVHSFEIIAEVVLSWLKGRLAEQVDAAKAGLADDLRPRLNAAIDARAEDLRESGGAIGTIDAVADLVKSMIGTRLDELAEWFDSKSAVGSTRATYANMAAVVEERYRAEVDRRKIRFDAVPESLRAEVPNDRVRLLFNLWSDLVDNALKHSGLTRPRFRIAPCTTPGGPALLFSATAAEAEPSRATYKGDPYKTPTEAVFREGNTGLTKVAALAASIVDAPVEIVACRGRRGFHVLVPLNGEGAVDG